MDLSYPVDPPKKKKRKKTTKTKRKRPETDLRDDTVKRPAKVAKKARTEPVATAPETIVPKVSKVALEVPSVATPPQAALKVPSVVQLKATRAGVEMDKLTDVEHILHAADFYIGQTCYTLNPPVSRFILNPETQLMEYKELQYPHGLLKLFDEALVNAADNRHKGTKVIKVGVSTTQNAVWVHNDGPNFAVVPTQYPSLADPSKPAYQPELAFFHPKTSSNYRKKQKVTGGKYGLGAKIIGAFSAWMTIEMCDGQTYYYQKATDHMTTIHRPKIKPATKAQEGKPFLNMCFSPDLKLFYPPGQAPNVIPDNMLRLFMTRVYDVAGTTPKDVKVMWSLNTDKFIAPKKCKFARVPVKDFKSYVKLFLTPELKADLEAPDSKTSLKIGYHSTDRWEVCIIQNPWPFLVDVSFVNNINTYSGGEHVKHIQSQVLQYCRTKVEGIDSRRVNAATMLFVNALIEDPSFNSQSKEVLLTVPSAFGSTCELPAKFMGVLNRNGVMDGLKLAMEEKDLAVARRTIGAGKHKPVHDIPNFRDARHAGTRQAHKCTLYFVEGVSAMELAEVGLSVMGNDYVGAFALKGKVINANASLNSLQKNKEFVNICRAMGLELGKDTPRSQLRYGRVVVLTDADPDGSHIKGLFIYMLRKFWPHLLKEHNFIDAMITPIVVATPSAQKKEKEYFYTLQRFEEWYAGLSESQRTRWSIKYYKGLATSTKKEGRFYFKNLRNHIRHFRQSDEKDLERLDMAFDKGKGAADQRKEWLQDYDASLYIPYDHIHEVSYAHFVDRDLKHYSWMTLRRNIPLSEDGFTPAARKCLWIFLQRKLTKDAKVATVQSWVDHDTNYHHGPDSLGQTIVRMAQQFVGKQNMNFFVPSGMFGSRKDGGKISGSTRYIFTRLQPVARAMFCDDDDGVLTLLEDEGRIIEPTALAPILPQVLINGSDGTATGYRSAVPTYRPEDLIEAVKRQLEGEPWQPIQPWYHKFKGSLTGDPQGNFTSRGIVSHKHGKVWSVTELPLGKWRDNYKEELTQMVNKGLIENFHEQHRNEDVCFEVEVKQDLEQLENPVQFFHLESSFSSQLNLLVLDGNSVRIRTFASIEEIFQHWFIFRLALYDARRVALIKALKLQIPFLQAKVEFIRIMIARQVPLGKKKAVMCQALAELKLDSQFHDKLLAMAVSSFSEEKITTIQAEVVTCQETIDFYEKSTPKTLWLRDLAALSSVLQAFWLSRFEKDDEEE